MQDTGDKEREFKMSQFWNFFLGLFGYVMQFCYRISFGNYVLALLFYALFFKLLLLPFAIKQQKSQIKLAALRPKMALIEKKYQGRNDKATLQKKQEEILEMQRREGYSPFSGCFPLLLQFPIIIALFNIIRRPLEFISRLSTEAIEQLRVMFDVAEKDQNLQLTILSKINETNIDAVREITGDAILPKLNVLGINVGATPTLVPFTILIIIPVLVFFAQFFSMKLMRKFSGMNAAVDATPEMQMSNKIMDIIMPLLTLYFAFTFPAAIGIYWIYQSLLGLLQSFILAKIMPLPTFTDEEIREMQKAAKRRATEMKAAPSPHSLHHIDDDDDDSNAVIPEIRSKYDDDGESTYAGVNETMKTPKKKNNASKKHPKKKKK